MVNKLSHFSAIITSPIGKLGYTLEDGKLTSLTLVPDSRSTQKPDNVKSQQVADELTAYFTDAQYSFQLNLQLAGTDFQQKVWHALQRIPSGKTLTYGDLAKKLKTAPRAIGQACRTNPILIIVPCHRIVAATHLGGYGGAQHGGLLKIKKWLLAHENT